MSTKYETRTITLMVMPAQDRIFSELATSVSIVDEAAGEFVEVSQSGRQGLGKIAISPEEWPTLRAAIDSMIDQCRDAAAE